MKKYTKALEIMLRHVAVREIISGDITYNRFGKSTFVLLANSYNANYSNDEIENLYTYFVDEIQIQKKRLFGSEERESGFLNVFELLLQFAENVLLESGDMPVCNYSKLLRWRSTSHILDEDIFLSSFLAYQDSLRPGSRRDLRWDLVTGTNNVSLKKLMERGIAENHFHLKGSSPYFHLSWISLMNDIGNPRFDEILARYDDRRLSGKMNYNSKYGEVSLYFMCMQAALIRLVLFLWLRGRRFVLDKCSVDADYLKTFFDYQKLGKVSWKREELRKRREERSGRYQKVACSDILLSETQSFDGEEDNLRGQYAKRMISQVLSEFWFDDRLLYGWGDEITLSEIVDTLLTENRKIPLQYAKGLISEKQYLEFEQRNTLELVQKILNEPDRMVNYQKEIEDLIQVQRWEQAMGTESQEMLDYAIPDEYSESSLQRWGSDTWPREGEEEDVFAIRSAKNIITGERWILYQMFRKYNENKGKNSEYMNLFYAYLVIKETIRSELIQVNTAVGFSNFSYYESRKEDFIEDTVFEKYLLKLAVWDIIKNRNVRSLEARITPKMSSSAGAAAIRKNDEAMGLTDAERARMFYVYHFVKAPEKREELESENLCRHAFLRSRVKRQALAFSKMREDYPKEASRVLGIDACNAEISCRPEVFAQTFRFLRNHIVPRDDSGNPDHRILVPVLGVTYHVGEDFLDVTDGLRAIDEACRFLNFRCGDRLGHALALGIHVREWYDSKDRRTFLTKQAYLDNIVWLYTKIREIGLNGYEDILLHIEKEYWQYFHEIYLKNISDSYVNGAWKRNNGNEPSRFTQFNITTYYDAWKLRGDDPERYRDGVFQESKRSDSGWEEHQIDRQFPEDYKLRLDFETAFLYHNYHYNPGVKMEGSKTIEVKVSDRMIQVVGQVQKHMQRKIAALGVGVEANPSSNYLIGTFRRYDKHPLLRFYNIGLTSDEKELQECPQISTSINTDDQGVFATSLENEYALMVLALERIKGEDGKAKYSRERIYKWLDDIREMGIRQSFLRRNR